VFIPAGTYQVNRHIVVDDVTIEGAGNWYTIIRGHQVTLASPLPDGSVHTGVGFYGKYVEDGAVAITSTVDFAIEGDVRERVDTDQANGVGGALSDSSVSGLYIHHTKVGLWFDGPMHDLTVSNTIVADVLADGVNFRRGVTNSKVVNSFLPEHADDAMAMWSHNVTAGHPEVDENANDVFDHNTVQTPTLANGSRSTAAGTPPSRTTSSPTRSARKRPTRRHALRQHAVRRLPEVHRQHDSARRDARVELEHRSRCDLALRAAGVDQRRCPGHGDNFLQSTYNAIMEVAEWSVKDLYSIPNVHYKDIHVDGTGTS